MCAGDLHSRYRTGEAILTGMMTPTFDLVVHGGTVIDPETGTNRVADVGIRDGRIAAVGPALARDGAELIDATGCIVTPGLIDLHAHVYAGVTPLSIDADPLASRSGTRVPSVHRRTISKPCARVPEHLHHWSGRNARMWLWPVR
ncbi:MAG: hypothetical protein EBT22_09480 [Chloroflexi bacterium]|nr:hypothetical protein [Chloroflexota bacterium]